MDLIFFCWLTLHSCLDAARGAPPPNHAQTQSGGGSGSGRGGGVGSAIAQGMS